MGARAPVGSAFRLVLGCVCGPALASCGLALRLCRSGAGSGPLRGVSSAVEEAPPVFRPAARVWAPAPLPRELAGWLCPLGSGPGPACASPRRLLAARGGVGARAPTGSAFRLLGECARGPASVPRGSASRLCRSGSGLGPLRGVSRLTAPPAFRPAACAWGPATRSRELAAWLCPSGAWSGPVRVMSSSSFASLPPPRPLPLLLLWHLSLCVSIHALYGVLCPQSSHSRSCGQRRSLLVEEW